MAPANRNVAAIHLGRHLHAASTQPTRMTDPETGWRQAPRHPYSVLLPVGFTLPLLSPETRWALTPPFHPYLFCKRWFAFCGTFPEVTLAGCYPAPCFRGARTFLTLPPFGIGKARLPSQLVSHGITTLLQKCQPDLTPPETLVKSRHRSRKCL